MGRQVNFFLLPEDMAECINRIQKLGEMVIFPVISSERHPKILNESQIAELDKGDYSLCVSKSKYLDRIESDYIAMQEYFYVDVHKSLAIELWQCKMADNILRRGRLYYTPSYYEDDVLVEKDPEFVKWTQAVLRAAVRGLKRDPAVGCHIGPHAEQLYKEGKIELSQM